MSTKKAVSMTINGTSLEKLSKGKKQKRKVKVGSSKKSEKNGTHGKREGKQMKKNRQMLLLHYHEAENGSYR